MRIPVRTVWLQSAPDHCTAQPLVNLELEGKTEKCNPLYQIDRLYCLTGCAVREMEELRWIARESTLGREKIQEERGQVYGDELCSALSLSPPRKLHKGV